MFTEQQGADLWLPLWQWYCASLDDVSESCQWLPDELLPIGTGLYNNETSQCHTVLFDWSNIRVPFVENQSYQRFSFKTLTSELSQACFTHPRNFFLIFVWFSNRHRHHSNSSTWFGNDTSVYYVSDWFNIDTSTFCTVLSGSAVTSIHLTQFYLVQQ